MAIFRLLHIVVELARFGVWSSVERLFPARRASGPERMCAMLTRLGVTFVKAGRALGLREDVLPPAYIAALQLLQDRVPPFPACDAIREIERGLGQPITQIFAHFERVPLAAASVAQVHAARLQDGREVIVKVRRIGLPAQVDADLRALLLLVRVMTAVMPSLRRHHPRQIIEEIWKELDFRHEARNIRRFAAGFADWPRIHVLQVVDDLVSDSVIVQERSSGRRIDDPALSPLGPQLAQTFVEAYLHQIFVLGFFHGDRHPGNLLIMADGRICFHDFGLIGMLDAPARRHLASFAHAFIKQDPVWLLDAALDLGILGGELDRAAFSRGLAEIMADYAGLPINEWSLADALLRVTRLGQAENVLVPYELLVLMRAMFVIDMRSASSTRGFSFSRPSPPRDRKCSKRPWASRSRVWTGSSMTSLGQWRRRRRLWRLGFAGLGLHLEISGLQEFKAQMERSTNRLTLALVTLGLYVAGSLGPRLRPRHGSARVDVVAIRGPTRRPLRAAGGFLVHRGDDSPVLLRDAHEPYSAG